MPPYTYTAITFAPVQGFIEKSRKLRDLYGSSFILSYLANAICQAARHYYQKPDDVQWPDDPVISPALIDVARGTPNQILIRGDKAFPETEAKQALKDAWKTLVQTCQTWIEENIKREDGTDWDYRFWQRPWQQWINHTWEFFWATGESSTEARENLVQAKFQRAWTGVNWVGESSTLSGLDSRAWPGLGHKAPHTRPKGAEEAEAREFYRQLSQHEHLTDATISPREQLSIPELVKRLVTIDQVIEDRETPFTFKGLNRWQEKDPDKDNRADPGEVQRADDKEQVGRWTGWFQGDGDKAGAYLKEKGDDQRHSISSNLRQWGEQLKYQLPKHPDPKVLDRDGRIIYAGGDDFMGVLYRNEPYPRLTPQDCLNWWYGFDLIWQTHGEKITASVGFVWVAPNVPQREILQQCREAEQAAKVQGRDRIALRILFDGGNSLQWICPWWCLETILESYTDRNGVTGSANQPNWTHFYNDVAALENRHAFRGHQTEIAQGLLEIYFGKQVKALISQHLWDATDDLGNHQTGLLGNQASDCADVVGAFNTWVINLAKVGFHLCSST